MKKYIIIVLVLILTHIIFFVTVDRNRSGIKKVLADMGIWDPKYYVFIQNKLTNKDLKTKSEDEKFLQELPKSFATNHFTAEHSTYDLEKFFTSSGAEDYNYGYITSVSKKNNFFKIVTNNGYLISSDQNFKKNKVTFLKDIIENFYTDYAYGGIRGAKWIDDKNLAIYTTIKKDDLIYVALILINIDEEIKVIDQIILEKLPIQDGTTSTLGGGIEMKDNKLYLSIGTSAVPNQYEINKLAQNDNSIFGKILEIKIYKENNYYKFEKHRIIAKGSRNPQGLKFINSELYEVEHGPQGGDEINIIDINSKKMINLGWPLFSYGTPYREMSAYSLNNPKDEDINFTYDQDDKSFLKPYFYFTPSIAISSIEDCPFSNLVGSNSQYNNCLILSSLKDQSFYIMKKGNAQSDITSYEKVYIGNRIRKMYTEHNTIYLFLDNLKIIKIFYKL